MDGMDAIEHLPERYCPIDRAGFLALTKGNEDPGRVAIRKTLELESVEIKGSTVTFLSTSGVVDRDRDIITPKGLSIEAWEENPVILFSHDARQRIGVGESRLTSTKRWLTTAEYFPKEISPLAESLRQMIEWRKARAKEQKTADKGAAFSIGFMRIKSAWNDERGGIDFLQTEKLEDSDVSIPANREALAREAFADGVPLDPLFDWAENCRKEHGLASVNAEFAQKLTELIDPAKGLTVVELTPAHLKHLHFDRESFEAEKTASKPPEAPAPAGDPVAMAFAAAKMGLSAGQARELLEAGGMSAAAAGIKEPAGSPEPSPEVAPEPPSKDWQDGLFESPESNGLPDKDQIKEAFSSVLTDEDLEELFIDRVAAKTGHIPDPRSPA